MSLAITASVAAFFYFSPSNMNFLSKIFGTKPKPPTQQIKLESEAVIVNLNGTDLPDEVYQKCDIATIEDMLIDKIEASKLGELDGHEIGPKEVAIFMYGPNAEQLFAGIESTLRSYPLCQKARVIIRRGGPGSKQREVSL